MSGRACHFHMDEWCVGTRLTDGSETFTCELRRGHPAEQPWSWREAPSPPDVPGLSGLAEELNLEHELPAALAALGQGWFEYGLVERNYARRCPEGFRRRVDQWSHTAIAPKRYTTSRYLTGPPGRLSTLGVVAYHGGRGTGRSSYNADISWWSAIPPNEWDVRTAWVDIIGDSSNDAQQADAECRSYVLPETGPTEESHD